VTRFFVSLREAFCRVGEGSFHASRIGVAPARLNAAKAECRNGVTDCRQGGQMLAPDAPERRFPECKLVLNQQNPSAGAAFRLKMAGKLRQYWRLLLENR